jgi:hypothetical protein
MKNRSRQNSLDFGEEPSEDKRRARKSKKNNNAELMNEFRDEIDDESSFAKQRAYYENLHHLSSNERAMFDAKFTKPKNDSQTYYATLLKQKSKKIVVGLWLQMFLIHLLKEIVVELLMMLRRMPLIKKQTLLENFFRP